MIDKKQKCPSIGGQALIEGIMMRGTKKTSMVVKTPDGKLNCKVENNKNLKDKMPILGWPFIRGIVNMVDSLGVGMRAISYSASFFEDEEGAESKFEKWLRKILGDRAESFVMGLAIALALFISVGLFFLLPTILVGLFPKSSLGPVTRSLIEGAIRISLLILYIFLVSRLSDIKRVFGYHGAEHKTIFAFEKGEELTVENVRKQSRLHPRCGTNFLFIVMFTSILIYSLLRWDDILTRFIMRLVLLPVVVGISYELIKLSGKYDNIFTRIICFPGMLLQRLTTNEPDDEMIEVAIEAVNLVLEPAECGSGLSGQTV